MADTRALAVTDAAGPATYHDFADRAARVARGFRGEFRLQPGDRVALFSSLGAVQALLPTLILIGAIAFQNVLTITGRFELLRRALVRMSPDPRLQLIFISFCYGALLEAIAGGGTPVLITVSMLVGLGFNAFHAARNSLLANSTPVAFGAVGLPFVYMALVTGLPINDISAMVGSQIPFTAILVPAILVLLFAGWKGIRATWPAIAIVSVVFAGAQALCAHLLGPRACLWNSSHSLLL